MRYWLLIVIFLGGCATAPIEQTATTSLDLFTYQSTFIGDSSKVLAIINELPESNNFLQLSLQTTQRPYGASLDYSTVTHPKIVAIANATWLFTLIPNVEQLQFSFNDDVYTLTRQQLVNWYNQDFTTISTTEELQLLIDTFTANATDVDTILAN